MKNKIVMVTGGTSGIGKACCEAFAAEGADLIILARREDKLVELAEELKGRYGVEVLTQKCDVRNYSEVEATVNSLPEKLKSIDILINNAGLARGLEKIQDGVLQNWEEMIDTNVKGLLYVSRLVLPLMIARNTGDVINIGSIAGHELYPAGNVYCGTKHAERAISKGMSIDLNGYNIRVCSIDPGMVETEFSLVRFHGDSERAAGVYKGLEALIGEDIARTALFVVSQPRHVNIQSLVVTPTAQASATILTRK